MLKRIKSKKKFQTIISYLLYKALRLLFVTYKLNIIGQQDINALEIGVFYFWHQNIISALYFFFKTKSFCHCIVSPSKDGKIAGAILEKLGGKVLYGSAYKNPINVVRTSLNILKTYKKLMFVGDSSRGPAFKLQPGIAYLAQKSQVPVVFIKCSASNNITFKKSWDKFKIPLPFSTIRILIETHESTLS